jgi:hypothetical protein
VRVRVAVKRHHDRQTGAEGGPQRGRRQRPHGEGLAARVGREFRLWQKKKRKKKAALENMCILYDVETTVFPGFMGRTRW